jgi:hypothetical protein
MLAKSTIVRIIISAVLTIVLLGVSRKMSTRNPQEVVKEFDGIIATHTTITESKLGVMPVVKVNLAGDQTAQVGGVLYYAVDNGIEQMTTMNHSDDITLVGNLPAGEIGERLVYRIELTKDGDLKALMAPAKERGYLLKYKGPVSAFVLIPHIILMFAGVFCSFMALFYGFDLILGKKKVKQAAIAVLLSFFCGFIGGVLIGIEVTREVFGGSGWGGWPIGDDVTDTKTEIFLLFWLVTMIFGWQGLSGRKLSISNKTFGSMIIVSFIITLIAFLIPHSISL